MTESEWTSKPSSRPIVRKGLFGLLLSAASALVLAQQPAETLPFFRPDEAIDSHGVDNVNVFNGDIGVAIPLGPEYALGPTGYRFRLTAAASNKFWHESTCWTTPAATRAYLAGDPTLGVGWTLQLGYVIHRTPPDLLNGWYYYSPDGGAHRVELSSTNPTAVTTDGSHLRITANPNISNTTSYTVEFPDGSVATFGQSLTPPNPEQGTSPDFTEFDVGETEVNRFGLTSVADRFNHTLLSVTYVSGSWRVAAVNLTPYGTNANINFSWTTKTDSGVTWDILNSITFPAPAGQTLKTQFAYADGSFSRNIQDNSSTVSCSAGNSPANVTVPELASITFSDTNTSSPKMTSFSYGFSYYSAANGTIQQQGAIQTVTLPSLGQITYTYDHTKGTLCRIQSCNPETLPIHAPDTDDDLPLFGPFDGLMQQLDNSPAVSMRSQTDPFTTRTDTACYTRVSIYSYPTNGQPDLNGISRRVTVTSGGSGTDCSTAIFGRRYFFHVSVADGGFEDQDSGLELDHRDYADASLAATVRTTISCFEGHCGYRDGSGNLRDYTANDRVPAQEQVTWYGVTPSAQDGGTCPDGSATTKCLDVTNTVSTYNAAAGKYRESVVTSNLATGSSPVNRTIETDWTATTTDEKWFLDKFDTHVEFDVTDNNNSDGATTRRSYADFDPATGFLKGSWTWDSTLGTKIAHCFYSGTNPDGSLVGTTFNDLSRTYTAGTPSADPCPSSFGAVADGDAFSSAYTWSVAAAPSGGFTMSTANWLNSSGVTIGWNRSNVARDLGYIVSSEDPNGFQTIYTYDPMGRIIEIAPPSPEWPTTVCFVPGAAGTTPLVLVKKTTSSNPLSTFCQHDDGDPTSASVTGTVLGYQYDGLGRLVREFRRMDHKFTVSGGTTFYSRREYRYDPSGNTTFSSEWQACPYSASYPSPSDLTGCSLPQVVNPATAPGPSTAYSNFDTFGRAQTINGPNGSSSVTVDWTDDQVSPSIQFSDTKQKVTVNNVSGLCSGTSCSGGVAAVTTTRRDGLNRVYSVTEPSNDITTYAYGVLDKLSQVSQGTQTPRKYGYYAFGFLSSEQTPENGASGNGTTNYSLYGSLGNLRTKSDGGITYNYLYDPAGRLTCLYTGTACGGSPTYAAGTYIVNCYDGTVSCADGTANHAGTNSNGKLTRRIGWNQIQYQAAPVDDDFDYDTTSRVATQRTQIGWPLVSQTGGSRVPTFPQVTTQLWSYNALGLPASHTHPSQRTLTFNYDTYHAGLVTNISASYNLVNQQIAAAQYQATGMLDFYSTGTTGTVVKTTIAPDAQVPSRPGRISTTGVVPSNDNFDTGAYSYDGAGNIVNMGADTFTYDNRSRLLSASLSNVGLQTYTYDQFGNMLSKAGTTFCTTSCTNNHLPGTNNYDVHGDLLSYGGESLTYDDLTRLTRSTSSSDFSFIYNGAGERVAKFQANLGIPRREYAHQIVEARGDTIPAGCHSDFTDVQCFSDADATYIEQFYQDGITTGCVAPPNGQFCPDSTITRQEAAVFLVKGKYCPLNGTQHTCPYTPPACTGVFADVPCPSQYANWIEKLYNDGVTGGCGGGNFCPTGLLTTWQSLAWLSNASAAHNPYWPNYHPLPREAFITYRDEENRIVSQWQSGTGQTQGTSFVMRDNAYMNGLLVSTGLWSGGANGFPSFSMFSSDHLGTPRLATDPSANWQESRKYWPFGDDATSSGSPTYEPLKFAAMERDDEANHYYDHARFENFTIGRFHSPEPTWMGAVALPQSWNRYTYSLNNPLAFKDGDGQFGLPIIAGIVVAGGLYGALESSLEYYAENGRFDSQGWIAAGNGFASGALLSIAAVGLGSMVGPVAAGALIGAGSEAVSEKISGDEANGWKIGMSGLAGAGGAGLAEFLGPRPGTFQASLKTLQPYGEFLAGRNVTRQLFGEVFGATVESLAGSDGRYFIDHISGGPHSGSVISSMPNNTGIFGPGAFWFAVMSWEEQQQPKPKKGDPCPEGCGIIPYR